MDAQLRGVSNQAPADLESDCESKFRYANESVAGDDYDTVKNAVSPCGLIAFSLFNDSFRLLAAGQRGTNDVYAGDTLQPVASFTTAGVAWPSDVSDKFHNALDGSTGNNYEAFAYYRQQSCADIAEPKRADCEKYNAEPYIDGAAGPVGWCFFGSGYCVEDEAFMVWMRTAGLPTFRKLYAVIDAKLEAGTYQIEISNGHKKTVDASDKYWNYFTNQQQSQLYPTHGFGGEKFVVLSTVTWMGGKNPFLGYAYVVVGAICFALALLFLIKDRLSPRRLGDPSYITFNKKDGDK